MTLETEAGDEQTRDSFISNDRMTIIGEEKMYEVAAEFDLHRVMDKTLKLVPSKPKNILRQIK